MEVRILAERVAMLKLYLTLSIIWSTIRLCPAPCSFKDCGLTDDINTGMYDDFCTEAGLFTPYIKIYRSRRGPMFLSGGPKLYPVHDEKDIYVCMNGPAWLYFAKHTPLGVVFHKPEWRMAIHHCQFFNGIKNPGNKNDGEELMGILLMGDASDYRKPSMQLFTAPLYNNISKTYENVTSIMTFGNQACYIQRGTKDKNVKLTIQPNPDNPNSYCQMAYQRIPDIFELRTPLTPAPSARSARGAGDTEPEITKFPLFSDTVQQLLKNDVELKQVACDKSNAITSSVTRHHNFASKIVAENNRTVKLKKQFEAELTKLTTSFVIPDDLKLDKEQEVTDNLTAIAASIADAETNKTSTDAATKENAEKELINLNKLKDILEFRKRVITECNPLKSDSPGTIPADIDQLWIKIDDYLKTQTTGETSLTSAVNTLNAVHNNWTTVNGNLTIDKLNASLKKQLRETAHNYSIALKEVNKELEKVGQMIIIAKEKSNEYLDKIKNCKTHFANLRNNRITERTGTDESTIIRIEEKSPHNQNQNCYPLPTVQTECENAKPKKNRACHFLKSIVHNPAICLQNEDNDITEIPEGMTTKKALGESATEILDLIRDIFAVACTFFPDSSFADRITQIFKCYLMKPEDHGGAGMKLPPEEKHSPHMQIQILKALRKCKSEKRQLKFEKDPNSGPRKHQQKYKYLHNGVLKDVHLHTEQADREFAFNFAIDMHFKMFATVIGLCMTSEGYSNRNSLMSTMFYASYSSLFYDPLRFAWTDPKDNRIFNLLLGDFKNQNGPIYASHCMEASFLHGGDTDYRPPRKLMVNGETEGNFFTSGNLANKPHKYL